MARPRCGPPGELSRGLLYDDESDDESDDEDMPADRQRRMAERAAESEAEDTGSSLNFTVFLIKNIACTAQVMSLLGK